MEQEDQNENIIMIRGFRVSFPKGRKPFAPQLALMSKMLMGVQKRENCLLESPTGTGKTLALLCAALAWHRQQRENALAMETACRMDGGGGDQKRVIDPASGPREPPRSFDEFRYVERRAGEGGPIELAYEEEEEEEEEGYEEKDSASAAATPGEEKPPGHDAPQDGCYGDDFDDDAFESPKKKRQKNLAPSDHRAPPGKNGGDGIYPPGEVVSAAVAAYPASRAEEAGSAASGAVAASAAAAAHLSRSRCDAFQESPDGCGGGGARASEGEAGLKPAAASGGKPSSATTTTATMTTGKAPCVKAERQGKMAAPKTPGAARRHLAPRVFFCSRTHSQLNQVVAELRTCRAAFEDTSAVGVGEDGKPFSMALLSSRKGTCINQEACRDPKGIDDACKRLLKEKACNYYRRAKRGQTLPPVYDVEEAVLLGKRNRACPYYTIRESLATADLILCPYNYLVDPGVREIMGINLKDAVVIFDEAHNLEDSAREAASAKLSLRALSNAAGEMHRLGANSPSLAQSYNLLRRVIIGVQAFLEEEDVGLHLGGYERAHKVFRGTEALGLMQSRAGVTAELLPGLKEALSIVVNENVNTDAYAMGLDEDNGSGEGRAGNVLSSGAVHVTASLVKVLGFLLAEGMENVDHYKMVVLRERGPWEPSTPSRKRGRNRGGAGSITAMETYLCFWCQSASTCFSDIDKQVHSIILTSGTLSPLDSFAGELGIAFPHRLEAPHVINVRKQCLVTSIGYFGGVSLDARYTNQHNLKYQDALGHTLLQHARVVPGGILVFFPSYGLMDKMRERWQVTGLLQALEHFKGVYSEPRGQGKIDRVLADYYKDIKAAMGPKENNPPSGRTGALMLAVARGKVSEGIDFSDDACRMCVMVGIPYPSSKDLQVVIKKEYQDQRRTKDPRLLDGRAWYNLQAFRAVNQAVGRCIRHRGDFGAIVLCDPRYGSCAETTASLSKWVRSSVKQCKNAEISLLQLAAFFQSHQQNSRREPAVVAPAPVGPSVDPSCSGTPGGNDLDAGCCNGGAGSAGGCEYRAEEHHPNGTAVEEFPEPELVQQSLSQMLRSSSATDNTAVTERGASVIQGTNGRTALQLLSQGVVRGSAAATVAPTAAAAIPRIDISTSTPEACTRPAPAVGRKSRSLKCRSGRELVSEPDGLAGACSFPADRPRRVLVGANCQLYHASLALPSAGGGNPPASSEMSADWRRNTTTLLEVPRGWTLGGDVSEGEGRWVANDGLVYAPLFCSCASCGTSPVGEKAVGAGLHGQDLIGRAWFYPARVQAGEIFDDSSPKYLLMPTHIAMSESTLPPDLRAS